MLGLVFSNLARRKARSLATAIGIALGVATVVALLSVGSGLDKTAGGLVHLGDADAGVHRESCARQPLDMSRYPIVVRLDGTNAEEGREILANAGRPNIHPEATMLEGARRAVELAEAA